MTRQKYFWQGEPVKITFGLCKVKRNFEKPLYWYNYECMSLGKFEYALIEAILIETNDGDKFCIANHFGIGAHKLKNGGWPNFRHFSIDVDDFFEFQSMEFPAIRELKEKDFSEHEKNRSKWFEKNYPEEWSKKQELLNFIKNRK